jgi:hypothetical protein
MTAMLSILIVFKLESIFGKRTFYICRNNYSLKMEKGRAIAAIFNIALKGLVQPQPQLLSLNRSNHGQT